MSSCRYESHANGGDLAQSVAANSLPGADKEVAGYMPYGYDTHRSRSHVEKRNAAK